MSLSIDDVSTRESTIEAKYEKFKEIFDSKKGEDIEYSRTDNSSHDSDTSDIREVENIPQNIMPSLNNANSYVEPFSIFDTFKEEFDRTVNIFNFLFRKIFNHRLDTREIMSHRDWGFYKVGKKSGDIDHKTTQYILNYMNTRKALIELIIQNKVKILDENKKKEYRDFIISKLFPKKSFFETRLKADTKPKGGKKRTTKKYRKKNRKTRSKK